MSVIPPPENDQEYELQDHSIRPRLSTGGPMDPTPPEQMHQHHRSEVCSILIIWLS